MCRSLTFLVQFSYIRDTCIRIDIPFERAIFVGFIKIISRLFTERYRIQNITTKTQSVQMFFPVGSFRQLDQKSQTLTHITK